MRCGPQRSSDEQAELSRLLSVRTVKGLGLLCVLKTRELQLQEP